MILEIVGSVCILIGTLFVLTAALGMVRFPDPLMRLHASTKAGTLGVAFTATGMMCYYPQLSIIARGSVLVVFLLLTAPVAAHMIGRAAYYEAGALDVEIWEGTVIDQMWSSSGVRPAVDQPTTSPDATEGQEGTDP